MSDKLLNNPLRTWFDKSDFVPTCRDAIGAHHKRMLPYSPLILNLSKDSQKTWFNWL